MIKNIVVFFLFTVALVGAQVPRVALPPPGPSRYYIHVVNGLSKLGLLVHCQSKDDDLGYHRLLNHGDDYQWNFKVSFWGSTLYWCKLETPQAYVSFESFWPETQHLWLRDRCKRGTVGTCLWTAKDDGIYLRNFLANVDELIHKWNYKS
ncbi:S-protein homolog 1-like [Cucurbita pepo subsp. pepo]|uniref:S-protein homolog 1-like n=1 Tax=Cucurbita pepo subsp. pepo TaxID=3664 RepID=UPI000C9D295A|nr:S-protein homolog 1-like [Cucurbita pepo subsp. pepo]XP_023536634.1 S-protein homolog 1-like [Cucurbita pepo subsp. pepo]